MTLVSLAPAASDSELDLHPAILEVEAHWHERESFLGEVEVEAADLVTVHQQLPPPVGVVSTDAVSKGVRGDVHAFEPYLAVLDVGVRVRNLHVASAQALDLTALQHQPGLERVEHVIVAAGPAVVGDLLCTPRTHWTIEATGRGDR